jgi:DNA repair ATPase RecN
MPDSSPEIRIERLTNTIGHVQDAQKAINERLSRIQNELHEIRRAHDRIGALEDRANEAQELARSVAEELERKRKDAEADARSRSKLIARVNYGLFILGLAVAGWSGNLKAGFDQIVQYMRGFK